MTNREAIDIIFGLAFQQVPALAQANQVTTYGAAQQILEMLRLASSGVTATQAAGDRDTCGAIAQAIADVASNKDALMGKFPFPTFGE